MFNRVSVWLDDQAPDNGAFPHANEWASRLRVPLHAIAAPARPAPGGGAPDSLLQACRAACARRGVPCDAEFAGTAPDAVRGFFRAGELSVFGANLPAGLRERLLGETLRNPKAAVMVCSSAWRPVSRPLVLRQGRGPGVDFLKRAVPLCRAFPGRPVVLTVTASEVRAAAWEESARETLYNYGLDADFDLIAGCEVRTAVAWAARTRGCSHVILERESGTPWWRRLRGESARRLVGLAETLTLLVLPGGGVADVPTGSGVRHN